MNDHEQFEGIADPRGGDNIKYSHLASWLQQVLQISPSAPSTSLTNESDIPLELSLHGGYHQRFYQQLPDFVMALLSNDPRAAIRYAPLLYHLAGCPQCHLGYVELYDAMRAALHPQRGRQVLGQGTRTLAATPQRMLGHFCRVLISQAESVLLLLRHIHDEDTAAARSLLLLAIHIGSHIGQSSIRRQALYDLVRVATLFDGSAPPPGPDPAVRRYTPALVSTGGIRGHKRIVRRGDMHVHPDSSEYAVIQLQSRMLEGRIVQDGSTLKLQLSDLDKQLRGHYVIISVPLGSLLEPVLWSGGNPQAIRSASPVDTAGQLVTPLGQTELQLSNPEDHNLLEVMFMLLEVRAAD